MVQHQLSAPLQFDLGGVELPELEQGPAKQALASATASGIITFTGLFQSSHPPLPLLRLSQNFFKQNIRRHPQDSPSKKVNYLFYLLSIVTARVRVGANITRLTDAQQLQAIDSMSNRPWVDEQLRQLLAEGRKQITSAGLK